MTERTSLTRKAGLERLAAFLREDAADYAAMRNTDHGPDARPTTSALSPFLRRRLLDEREVVAAARAKLGERGAEKFVSEVFWRTYFKGYLETHPGIWSDCLALARAGHDRLDAEPGLRRAYAAATDGRTGIDCFDAWSRELVETNWLHNHTRMWFASIWIFTLRLPWALGADFFMRHLLDGDPASNTLSWRWVAGLHTRGKHYVARAENIRRYTDGRFDAKDLDENPTSLEEDRTPAEVPLPAAHKAPAGEVALLLHLDDLTVETLPLDGVRRVAGLLVHAEGAADRVKAADREALNDGLKRAAARFGCPVVALEDGWAADLPVVTPWAPGGPSAAALPSDCLRVRRPWDEVAWPRATRGYSRLRSAIPDVLDTCGVP
ncbi:FAD-binding domain-containing protein [Aureimonas phyllosphaerae]|uniref:Deoxyribodipyrimidine photo-lyase n=1 Tax=Aureimonas phyllosphaerae TaxID=1166078 RepID=A0A7W6BWR5_9HYPH|nr:FAD-binding domain-containing protein [Aureimonas phyllosphaerae]MBB3934197.1 deoxyribodipyrimidine photo-lyase [Aureimonas phyllosphaerae]MBB3958587.1 deoxyribodipyrimidine photo-lyase [Aureimonas phyllosphaerae]SFE99277.1 deoxyribodipyrimidine photo-lyase [Aureimonas phyllosphaerae]